MLKKITAVILSAAVLMLSGCVDISSRTLPPRPVMASTTEPVDIPDEPIIISVATTTAPLTEETTPSAADSEHTTEEFYSEFEFTDEDYSFLDGCVFVGDSICSGLGHYGIIPMDRVIAQGNIAARNIFDFTFSVDGGEMTLITALVNAKPEYIVFSMGINDVNITSEQEFAENYKEILTMTEGFLPEAKLIVLSITPIDSESTFTTNEHIDGFNYALKNMAEESERWIYVDVTGELKNSDNALKSDYSSGDGIHLSPDAYYATLYQLCRSQLGDTTTEPDTDEGLVVE